MKSININSARGFLIQTSAGCDPTLSYISLLQVTNTAYTNYIYILPQMSIKEYSYERLKDSLAPSANKSHLD